MECTLCATGTYSDDYNATICDQCPVGTENGIQGAKSIHNCTACTEGRFAHERGSEQCHSCFIHETSVSPRTLPEYCQCRPGYESARQIALDNAEDNLRRANISCHNAQELESQSKSEYEHANFSYFHAVAQNESAWGNLTKAQQDLGDASKNKTEAFNAYQESNATWGEDMSNRTLEAQKNLTYETWIEANDTYTRLQTENDEKLAMFEYWNQTAVDLNYQTTLKLHAYGNATEDREQKCGFEYEQANETLQDLYPPKMHAAYYIALHNILNAEISCNDSEVEMLELEAIRDEFHGTYLLANSSNHSAWRELQEAQSDLIDARNNETTTWHAYLLSNDTWSQNMTNATLEATKNRTYESWVQANDTWAETVVNRDAKQKLFDGAHQIALEHYSKYIQAKNNYSGSFERKTDECNVLEQANKTLQLDFPELDILSQRQQDAWQACKDKRNQTAEHEIVLQNATSLYEQATDLNESAWANLSEAKIHLDSAVNDSNTAWDNFLQANETWSQNVTNQTLEAERNSMYDNWVNANNTRAANQTTHDAKQTEFYQAHKRASEQQLRYIQAQFQHDNFLKLEDNFCNKSSEANETLRLNEKYRNTTLPSDCEACPAGKYQDKIGGHACIECPAGTFRASSAASSFHDCVACGKGGVAGAGSSTCTDCLPGKYSSEERGASCELCPKGFYHNMSKATDVSDCKSCAAGKYANVSGMTKCFECAENKTSSQNSTDISNCTCMPGFFPHEETCQPCEPGSYKDMAGDVECTQCEAGKYNAEFNASHASSCVKCGMGWVAAPGSAVCTQCGPGTYNDNDTALECTECGLGTYVSFARATSESNCSLCEAGTYGNESGMSQCHECGGNKSTVPGSDGIEDCECKEGYFWEYSPEVSSTSIDTFTDYSQNEIVTQNVFSKPGNHGNRIYEIEEDNFLIIDPRSSGVQDDSGSITSELYNVTKNQSGIYTFSTFTVSGRSNAICGFKNETMEQLFSCDKNTGSITDLMQIPGTQFLEFDHETTGGPVDCVIQSGETMFVALEKTKIVQVNLFTKEIVRSFTFSHVKEVYRIALANAGNYLYISKSIQIQTAPGSSLTTYVTGKIDLTKKTYTETEDFKTISSLDGRQIESMALSKDGNFLYFHTGKDVKMLEIASVGDDDTSNIKDIYSADYVIADIILGNDGLTLYTLESRNANVVALTVAQEIQQVQEEEVSVCSPCPAG